MHGMDPRDEIDYWRARAEAAESSDSYSATALRIMRERDAALTRAERAEGQLAAALAAKNEACDIADRLNGDMGDDDATAEDSNRIAELRKVGAK